MEKVTPENPFQTDSDVTGKGFKIIKILYSIADKYSGMPSTKIQVLCHSNTV